jgi:hypothetical protein
MSADRLNPAVNAMEVQLFTGQLDELCSNNDIVDVLNHEVRAEVKDTALLVVRNALELGIFRNRQYHNRPLNDGRFELLANFEGTHSGSFSHFRLTTNKITEIKNSIYSVAVQDFRLRLHTGTVAMRYSTQLVKDAPHDLLEGSLPVIWGGNDIMRRYWGKGYTLFPPTSLAYLDYPQLANQLDAMRQLDLLVKGLDQTVTLEAKYPY